MAKKKSFWKTLPGILKGLAVVITAATGLYLALATETPEPIPLRESIPNSYSTEDSSKKSPASITISYSLGHMVEGRAIVYIEGREVGSLYIEKSKQSSAIDVTLPKPGSYEYSVQAKMTVMGVVDLDTGFELPFEVESNGRGTIEVEDRKEFILTTNNLMLGGDGNNTYYAALSDKALQ